VTGIKLSSYFRNKMTCEIYCFPKIVGSIYAFGSSTSTKRQWGIGWAQKRTGGWSGPVGRTVRGPDGPWCHRKWFACAQNQLGFRILAGCHTRVSGALRPGREHNHQVCWDQVSEREMCLWAISKYFGDWVPTQVLKCESMPMDEQSANHK
jgi:hypothetical protein